MKEVLTCNLNNESFQCALFIFPLVYAYGFVKMKPDWIYFSFPLQYFINTQPQFIKFCTEQKCSPVMKLGPSECGILKHNHFCFLCREVWDWRDTLLKYLHKVWEVLNLSSRNNEQPPSFPLSSAGILACLLLGISRSLPRERHLYADM